MWIHWLDFNGPKLRGSLRRTGRARLNRKDSPQAVPATGVLDYRDIPIDLGLTEDRWVRAGEVALIEEVLHHIITTVIPPGGCSSFVNAINSLPEERAAAIRAEVFAAWRRKPTTYR